MLVCLCTDGDLLTFRFAGQGQDSVQRAGLVRASAAFGPRALSLVTPPWHWLRAAGGAGSAAFLTVGSGASGVHLAELECVKRVWCLAEQKWKKPEHRESFEQLLTTRAELATGSSPPLQVALCPHLPTAPVVSGHADGAIRLAIFGEEKRRRQGHKGQGQPNN